MSNPAIDLALKTVKQSANRPLHPFYGEEVKIKGGLFDKTKIIVLSDSGLAVVKNNGKKIEEKCTWFDFKQFDYEDEQLTIVIGTTTYSLQVPEGSQLIKKIGDALQMVLTPIELMAINPNLKSKPTPKSAYYRATIKYPKYADEIGEILKFSKDTMIITQENFTPFISIVPLISSLTTLIIEFPLTADQYQDFISFLSKGSKIQQINFDGPVPQEFNAMMNTIAHNIHTEINSLSFTNSLLSDLNMQSILTAMNSQPIKSIAFHGTFTTQTFYFYETFLPAIRKSPRYINLANTNSVNLKTLYTQRLAVISLEGTGIDISTIFESLSLYRENLQNLRMINVSNNICSKRIDYNKKMPPLLKSIFADSIQWRGFHMRSFFELIFRNYTKHLFKLSFQYQSATQGDWNSINDLFSVTSFSNFVGLNWSGNPVNLSFISFLSRQKYLQFLNVSECFSDEKANEIKLFGNYLEGCTCLKKIVMRGNQIKNVGKMVGYLFSILVKKQVPNIDLSDNYCNDVMYKQLQMYYDIDFPMRLNIDGCNSDKEKFSEFLKNYLKIKTKILISWPEKDIKRTQNKSEIREMQKYFCRLNIREEPSDPFHVPLVIYKMSSDNSFPEFISNEDLSILMTNQTNPNYLPKIEIKDTENTLFRMSMNKENRGRSNSLIFDDKPSLSLHKEESSQEKVVSLIIDEEIGFQGRENRSRTFVKNEKPFIINVDDDKPQKRRHKSPQKEKEPVARNRSLSMVPQNRAMSPEKSPKSPKFVFSQSSKDEMKFRSSSFQKSDTSKSSDEFDPYAKKLREKKKNKMKFSLMNQSDKQPKTPVDSPAADRIHKFRKGQKKLESDDEFDFEEVKKINHLDLTLSDEERQKNEEENNRLMIIKQMKNHHRRSQSEKKPKEPVVEEKSHTKPLRRRRNKQKEIVNNEENIEERRPRRHHSVAKTMIPDDVPKKRHHSPPKTMVPDDEIQQKPNVRTRSIPQTMIPEEENPIRKRRHHSVAKTIIPEEESSLVKRHHSPSKSINNKDENPHVKRKHSSPKTLDFNEDNSNVKRKHSSPKTLDFDEDNSNVKRKHSSPKTMIPEEESSNVKIRRNHTPAKPLTPNQSPQEIAEEINPRKRRMNSVPRKIIQNEESSNLSQQKKKRIKRRKVPEEENKQEFVGKNHDELMEDACDSLLDEYVPVYVSRSNHKQQNSSFMSAHKSPLKDIKPISLISSDSISYSSDEEKQKNKKKWKFPEFQQFPPKPTIWEDLDNEFSIKKMVDDLSNSPTKSIRKISN